jgi:hypothetical protein
MFKNYDAEIRKILEDKDSKADWKKISDRHRLMIARIQHERLIHLLVTIFVGLVVAGAAIITVIVKTNSLLIFIIPLTLLFIGYLLHYRFLENTTQNWYLFEDKIKENR